MCSRHRSENMRICIDSTFLLFLFITQCKCKAFLSPLTNKIQDSAVFRWVNEEFHLVLKRNFTSDSVRLYSSVNQASECFKFSLLLDPGSWFRALLFKTLTEWTCDVSILSVNTSQYEGHSVRRWRLLTSSQVCVCTLPTSADRAG